MRAEERAKAAPSWFRRKFRNIQEVAERMHGRASVLLVLLFFRRQAIHLEGLELTLEIGGNPYQATKYHPGKQLRDRMPPHAIANTTARTALSTSPPSRRNACRRFFFALFSGGSGEETGTFRPSTPPRPRAVALQALKNPKPVFRQGLRRTKLPVESFFSQNLLLEWRELKLSDIN